MAGTTYKPELDTKTLGVIRPEDLVRLSDIVSPYIRVVNKPATKGLKSKEGADLNTGEMGFPVKLQSDCGWSFLYYPPKDKESARVEISSGLCEQDRGDEQATLQSKVFKTAIELVDFMLAQGWEKFKIEEGSPLFKWAVWAYLKHSGKTVTGYKPTEEDKLKLKHSKYLFESKHKVGVAAPTLFPGGGSTTEEE